MPHYHPPKHLPLAWLLIALFWLSPVTPALFAQGPSSATEVAAAPKPSPAFNTLQKRAEEAWKANQMEDAAKLYRQAVGLRPAWPEGWGRLASSLFQLNRYAQARDAYRQTTVLTPKNGPSWAFLGLCEYELREYRPAFDHLVRSEQLGLGPDRDLNAQVKYHLAILWDTAGQFEAGLKEISWFPEQNLGSPEIIEAIGLSVLRRPWFPYEIPADQRGSVVEAGAAGFAEVSRQPDKAKALFEQLVSEYPKEHDAHYAYGHFLANIDPEAALREYKAELEITPSHVPARTEAAVLCLQMGQPENALRYAQEANNLEPNNASAHNLAGRALSDMGRPKDAIAELVAATRLEPKNSAFHLQLARAYQKTGETALATKEMAAFNDLEKKGPPPRPGFPAPPSQ